MNTDRQIHGRVDTIDLLFCIFTKIRFAKSSDSSSAHSHSFSRTSAGCWGWWVKKEEEGVGKGGE